MRSIPLMLSCVLVSPVTAQVTATAITISETFAEAEHLAVQPLDRGSLPMLSFVGQGLHLDAASGGAQASVSFVPESVPWRRVGGRFEMRAVADTMLSTGGARAATGLSVLVILASPVEVSGVLAMSGDTRPSGGPGTGQGRIYVDVYNDGIDELQLNPARWPRALAWFEMPVTIGPPGTLVRITHGGDLQTEPFSFDDYACWLELHFHANCSSIAPFGPPQTLDLVVMRLPDGDSLFRLNPLATDAWLLFGFDQQSVPLTFPPFDSQLVSIDFFASMPGGQIVVPGLQLPPGLRLNAQAASLRDNGEVWMSGAVSMGILTPGS